MSLKILITNGVKKLKEGDTATGIKMLLLDGNGVTYDIQGKTVTFVVSNKFGKLFEKPATPTTISGEVIFSVDEGEITGSGQLFLEVHVQEGTKKKIFPSSDYLVITVDENLNVVGQTITFLQFENLKTDLSQELGFEIDVVQKQIDQLIIDGDSSPESAQARIGFDGHLYPTLKARIDAEMLNKPSGSPKGVYANLAALQSAKPSGDGNIYITSDNGNWNYYNGTTWVSGGVYQGTTLAANGVTAEKLAPGSVHFFKHTPDVPIPFKVRPKNLYNKNAVTTGKYVKNSDGTLADNATYTASEFIPVKGSASYTMTYRDQCAWYDSNKTYISGVGAGADNPYTVTAPTNAAYIRISSTIARVPTLMFEESATASPYESYYTDLKIAASEYVKDGTVTEGLLADAFKTKFNRLLSPAEILGKELNDATRSVRIKLLGDSITHGVGGTGYAEDGDLIPGTTVRMNPNGYCWANSLKGLLASKYNGMTTFAFNDPKIALKTTAYISNASNYQFTNTVPGATLLEFKFKGDEVRLLLTTYSNGGKVDVYLDGVLYMSSDSYSPTLVANVEHTITTTFGEHTLTLKGTNTKNASSGSYIYTFQGIKFNRKVTLLNYAQSGKNSNHFYTQRDTVVETGDDFVIMQLGTNDRHNMTTPSDTKRYQRAIIETAYAKGAKVILMSSVPTTVAGDNDPIRYFGMYDVDRAIRELAYEYNMDYISNYDGFLEYGENRNINIDTLLSDGLHPNDAGYDVMFRNIVRRLNIHYVRPGITK